MSTFQTIESQAIRANKSMLTGHMGFRGLICIAMLCFCTIVFAQSTSPNTKWHWDKGTIVVESPARPVGQKSALGLSVPKIETVRVGFAGLGSRGPWAVNRYCHIPGVQIVALCDYEEGRARDAQKYLRNVGLPPADIYSGATGYIDMCKREDIDLIYIATDWDHHFPIAKCALENGKHTAIEVPSAMNLEQCWELIDLSEKNRLHCMLLENCCYDYYEMCALNMAQQGLFGEIIRAEGAYIHMLNEPGIWKGYWQNPDGSDTENLHWRLKYNKENRGDIYPTHGLGPIAQVLNIHRGDRIKTLIAMDTESFCGREGYKEVTGKDCDYFRNGDHTTTLMRTEKGKVMEIQHNVMSPQPCMKGFCTKYPDPKIFVSKKGASDMGLADMAGKISGHNFLPKEEYDALMKKYYHPILKKFGDLGREFGHGGMDYTMDARLVYCLQNGLPLDIDVYDLAEWCALAELGALSMDNGCAAVAFPDFTRGGWNEQQGYRHAYASPEDEAAAEKAARESTERQKEMAKKKKLWEKYDKNLSKNQR